MHGRPREKHDAPQDPEKIRKQQQKAALFGQLMAAVLGRRAEKRYDAESMALSANLLCLNPEVYTVWNYRREALHPVLEDASSEAARVAVQAELDLTEKGLRANPKSYAAWHHRGWVVEHGAADLQAELKLVKKLLYADDRNFHGWAYWRWIVRRAGLPPQECLDYTTAKLKENFSNYSAWHARSALLAAAATPAPVQTLAQMMVGGGSVAMPAAGRVPQEELDREFGLVHQALWTEPRDQSGWLYHRWLLGSCLAVAGIADGSAGDTAACSAEGPGVSPAKRDALGALHNRLRAEAAMCERLMREEPEVKWPVLTLARVCEAAAAAGLPDPRGHAREHHGASASDNGAAQQPALEPAAGAAVAGGSRARSSSRVGATRPAPADSGSASNVNPGAAGETGPPMAATAEAGMAVGHLYEQLTALDPMRVGYYHDAAAGQAHVVLRAANT